MQQTATRDQQTPLLKAGTINHLVILCMENRSFDHYFGALALHHPERGISGLAPGEYSVPDKDGNLIRSWRMDEAVAPVQAHDVADIPHGYDDARQDWNDGRNDGFLKRYDKYHQTKFPAWYPMGFYTRETLSVLYALADEFTLCDRWFASILSSTWPNRKYLHSGCRDGDNDTQVFPGIGGFKTHPIYEMIAGHVDPVTGKAIDWRCYYSDMPFLLFWDWFAIRNIDKFEPIDAFARDCAENRLPAISIIDPPFSLASDHPPHDPRVGEKFIALVVDALTHSPSWEDSALVILYDEFGGFFDHVAPPPAPEPSPVDTPLGFRVPALVVSPFARKSVCHTTFDHTSVMRSIGERWNIRWDDAGDKYGTRWKYSTGIWDGAFDFDSAPRPRGHYTGPEVAVDWEQGLEQRRDNPLGDFEIALQHLLVFRELAALDNRRDMHDTLHRFEDAVSTLKGGTST